MLTKEQKQKILIALCWPVSSIESGNVNFHSVINDRLNSVDDVFIEGQVQAMLEKIDSLQDSYSQAAIKGNIRRIDDIEFDTNQSSVIIKREENRLKKMISDMLDIPSKCRSGHAGVCW